VHVTATLVARLHRDAGCVRWRVTVGRFAEALEASAARAFADREVSAPELDAYLKSLRLEDLALACACADGDDEAWDHFVREHRPGLYRAAAAIAPGGGGRELADSLYADLFGLQPQGERRSLFRYFHGRSSLATWLRAVLAQRHIDVIRATRRFDQLDGPGDDDEGDRAAVMAAPSAAVADPERARWLTVMRRAMARAMARLTPRDRLRIGCYYAEELTLAQIGRSLGEHEATVSRHLKRTRRALRDDVEHELRTADGLSDASIAQCFASVSEDPGTLDVAEMLGDRSKCKETGSDRSTKEVRKAP
jgi:RNA polymerase sigma factor (sigma-70 family)